MPIERFRDFEDAREALWVDRDDPELHARIRRLWAFAERLAPSAVPVGIQRFRSLEEADAERDRRTARRIAELRELRDGAAQD